jgi:hypothetical protein
MQYTICNVPGTLDKALRSSARERGKSLNEVTIAALARVQAFTAIAAASAIWAISPGHGAKIWGCRF